MEQEWGRAGRTGLRSFFCTVLKHTGHPVLSDGNCRNGHKSMKCHTEGESRTVISRIRKQLAISAHRSAPSIPCRAWQQGHCFGLAAPSASLSPRRAPVSHHYIYISQLRRSQPSLCALHGRGSTHRAPLRAALCHIRCRGNAWPWGHGPVGPAGAAALGQGGGWLGLASGSVPRANSGPGKRRALSVGVVRSVA